MIISGSKKLLGEYRNGWLATILGWATVAIMTPTGAAAVYIAMEVRDGVHHGAVDWSSSSGASAAPGLQVGPRQSRSAGAWTDVRRHPHPSMAVRKPSGAGARTRGWAGSRRSSGR